MNDKAQKIATAVKAAHDGGETYVNLTGDLAPGSLEAAYDAQSCLHRLHATEGIPGVRGPLGGYKIALSSKTMQELCGVDAPAAGGIFAREIFDSPATILLGDYHGLGIEFELAIRLKHPVTAEDGPFDAINIRDYIASTHAAFELIIDRKADYTDLDALSMIADNAWCGGVVIGPAMEAWQDLDLSDLASAMIWNDGAPEFSNTGLADPLGSLAWVCNHVTARGERLDAGDIVITGSVINTRWPKAGDRVSYDIGGLSTVTLAVS